VTQLGIVVNVDGTLLYFFEVGEIERLQEEVVLHVQADLIEQKGLAADDLQVLELEVFQVLVLVDEQVAGDLSDVVQKGKVVFGLLEGRVA